VARIRPCQPCWQAIPAGVGPWVLVYIRVSTSRSTSQALSRSRAVFEAGSTPFEEYCAGLQVDASTANLAARRTPRGDHLETAGPGVGRGSLRQQPLGPAGGRLRGIKTGRDQRRGPIVAQVNGIPGRGAPVGTAPVRVHSSSPSL